MAGSKSRRHFLFTGNDERFISGNAYTIRQISDITGMTPGVIRNRLQDIGGFNDSHLFGVRPWGSRLGRSLSKSQKAIWYTKKAKIVKACVFSETRFLLADDPVRLQKVNRWLDLVEGETEKFWHGIDYLTLDEIIKIAVKKDVAA